MKRLTTILLIALRAGPVAGPAAAQTAWTIGFKGGVALAELGGDDLISASRARGRASCSSSG